MTNSNKNKSGKKNYAMINLFTMLPVSNYVRSIIFVVEYGIINNAKTLIISLSSKLLMIVNQLPIIFKYYVKTYKGSSPVYNIKAKKKKKKYKTSIGT